MLRFTACLLTLGALAGVAPAQSLSIVGGEIVLASGDASGSTLSVRGTVRILPIGTSSGASLTITDATLLEASACPGDLSNNGVVDAGDLAALLSDWGQSGAADLDGNGTVGPSDLALLIGAWGPCF